MRVVLKKILLPTIFISLFYIVLVIYSINISLIKDTLLGDYSLVYKLKIMTVLMQGMWTSMSISGMIVLWIVAVLTGANITLLYEKITTVKKFDKLQVVIGGNSLLGIVGSGCAACGLPILSLLGVGGSIVYFPFHGAELSYLSIILLGISLFLLLKGRTQVCKVQYAKKYTR
ncbi:hypothetical protein BH11PAT1_BH11PAT1_5120 [soil metagenome]